MPRTKRLNVVPGLFGREIGLGSKRCKMSPSKLLRGYAESTAAVSTKNEHCEISGQARSTLVMTFSRDGSRIASTHGDHTIRVTDLRNGKCTHVLQGHPRTPWCVAFHPASSDILASGCLAGEVRIWDLKGGGSEIWHSPEGLSVASLAFHPADNVLVFAIGNRLWFWAWKQPEPYLECRTSREFEKIRWVKFDPLGHCLYTGIANSSTIVAPDDNYLSVHQGLPGVGRRFGTSSRLLAPGDLPLLGGELSHLLAGGNVATNPMSVFEPGDETREFDDAAGDVPREDHTFEQLAESAVASAQQYAADVTDRAQRAALGVRRPASASSYDPPPAHRSRLYATDPADDAPPHEMRRGGMAADAALSSVWESPYVSDLSRRRRRLLRNMNNPPWQLREPNPASVWPEPTSWQTRSSLETSFVGGPELLAPSDLRATPLEPTFTLPDLEPPPQRIVSIAPRAPGEMLDPGDVLRSASRFDFGADADHRPSGLFSSSSSLSEADLRRRLLDDASDDNDLEEITSTGAEAGSTASLGGDNESLDADGDARSAEAVDMGSVGAEVGSTGVGHGAEIGFGEIPSIVIHPDGVDCGPATASVDGPTASLRRIMRPVPRPPDNFSENGAARRWRRFSRADIRNPDLHASTSASSLPLGPTPFSDDLDWNTDAAPRRMPLPRRSIAQWSMAFANSDTSAASVDPLFSASSEYGHRPPSYRALRHRDFLNPHASGAASSSSGTAITPHVCQPDCEICGGNASQPSTRTRAGRHLPWRLTEITFDRLQSARTSGARSSTRWPPTFDTLAPAASAVDDPRFDNLDLTSDALASLHREIEGARRSVSSLQWRRPDIVDLPEATEFERRVRRLDERVTRMQQRLTTMQAEREMRDRSGAAAALRFRSSALASAGLEPRPSSSSLRERLRERQERIRFHLNELRTRYGDQTPRDVLLLGRGGAGGSSGTEPNFADDVLGPSAGLSGFGSTGADAVNDFLGNEDQERIVNRLRRFREEIRQMRADMNRSAAATGVPNAEPRRPFAPGRNLRTLFEPADMASSEERLQAAINQAIHGAFIANGGEPSVGNNIMDQTYRIQAWDFTSAQPPNLAHSNANVIVRRAKLHNDSSCDLSQDGRLLCTFIQTSHSFNGDVTLGVFSLRPSNRGQCLYKKTFGPNAISVSLSPLNNYVLVGLASKRFTWIFTPKQLVAQVYQLKTEWVGESSMMHVHDVMHSCDMDFRAPVSMNSARWLLTPGEGLVYGTNRGDLHIRRPGLNQREKPDNAADDEISPDTNPVRQSLMQMLGLTAPRTMSTATQTGGAQRSAGTQTDGAESSFRRLARE